MWTASPLFEPTNVLYITPTDNASMQELVMQKHGYKLYQTCSRYKKDTWHVVSKNILQHLLKVSYHHCEQN